LREAQSAARVTVSLTARLTDGNGVSAAGWVGITVLPPLLSWSFIDCLDHLSALLGDRVFYGCGVRKSDGEPVLLIPGFFAGDWTMSTMARWLARLGYRPYLSGIDWNVGCPDRKVAWLGRRIDQITRGEGRPVVLVGHSLGGVLARAAAVESPERVRHVVMLGAPRNIDLTAIRPQWRPALRLMQSLWGIGGGTPRCGTSRCPCGFAGALSTSFPAGVGLSSIFGRGDEVIGWHYCVDPEAQNYEVCGNHLSLLVNRHVYRLVGEILAGHGEAERKARETSGGLRCP
jgi:triacylglycerol lipase